MAINNVQLMTVEAQHQPTVIIEFLVAFIQVAVYGGEGAAHLCQRDAFGRFAAQGRIDQRLKSDRSVGHRASHGGIGTVRSDQMFAGLSMTNHATQSMFIFLLAGPAKRN